MAIRKSRKRLKAGLPKPKITLDRIGQIIFTLREVTKLALRTNPKLLTAVFILNALWGFSAVPGFYLEKLIIDRLVAAVGHLNWQSVIFPIGILVTLSLLLSLFRNFLGSYNSFLRRSVSRYFEAELTVLLGSKLAQLDMATIESPDFQDKFNKIEKESGQRAWGLMMPLSNISNYLVGFASSVGILVFLNPLIAVGVFLFSLPQFFINSKYIKKDYELSTSLSPLRRLQGWLDHYLVKNRNFMELKILDLTDYLARRLRKVVNEIVERRIALSRKRELSRFGSFLPLTLYELGISLLLIFWVVVQKITVGSFQLYLRSLRSAEQNLSGLVSSFLEIYENYIYVSDLVWFLNLEPGIEKVEEAVVTKEIESISIEFKNVWFRYQDDQAWIIKDVSFKILAGERIAMVGENGAGKSTLIKLLARFYDPQKGSILINGKDIKTLNLKLWRKQLAVLFQDFEGYPFSVKEAIGYGDIKRMSSLKEIKKVAGDTGIDKFVESLPLKYNTPINPRFEKGIHLSNGQWQRVAISRTLFRKNAKLLILDEPTSNVDPEAEEMIFQKLVKLTKNKILIFVTQRFSTVRIADRIFVVHQGKVIEQGTHRQLMKKNGKYARLYNLQAQAYNH